MPFEHRLHPTSVFFGFSAKLRELLLPLVLVLFSAGRVGWGWEIWVAALVIPYAFVSVARYVSFRYGFGEDELVIREGLIFRNERHVPYARIQNLDAVETVFHRMAGVVEVRVQTGGGQEPEGVLRVISRPAYDEMRRRVLDTQRDVSDAEQAQAAQNADEGAQTLLHLKPRDLVIFGLIENRGWLMLAAAVGAVWEIGFMDRFVDLPFEQFIERREFVRNAARDAVGQVGWVLGRAMYAAVAFLALLVLIHMFSVAWALVRLYDYRLTRRGEDLRAEFGSLTRVAATIPLRRIQTLTVREGPLHRLTGRVSVRADTAGGHGDQASKTQREWLAPILPRDHLPAFVAGILPELDFAGVDWRPVAPRAFRRAVKEGLVLVTALTLGSIGLLGWGSLAVPAVLLPLAVVHARLAVRHLGWAVTDRAVLFRSGWLWRRMSVARFARIQAVALHESPFDRRARMARVRVDTAGAGDLSHRVDIPYLPAATAEGLCARLAEQAGRAAVDLERKPGRVPVPGGASMGDPRCLTSEIAPPER